MRRAIDSFRGEAPRVTPRALPDVGSQAAVGARLLTGDLTAFRQFSTEHGLANTGPVRSAARIGPSDWMSWDGDVDAARGTTSGDTTYRTYLTGPDTYTEPRFTTLALATTGSEPYPVSTRPLGVPAPDTPPTTTVGVDPTASTFSINVLDEGDALATAWTRSTAFSNGGSINNITQDAAVGNPAPSYRLDYQENHNEGEQAFMYRNFGTASAVAIMASCDFQYGADTGVTQAILQAASTIAGVGLQAYMHRGFLSVRSATGWSPYATAVLAQDGPFTLAAGVWHTLTLSITVNGDGTATATATVFTGSAQIATVTGTTVFVAGDYAGVVNGDPTDLSPYASTYYDNILVQASGSTGYVPTNLATSYVYTFVNDLSQESAPSLPSATILRPDGVAVTITTPVDVPSGILTDYGINAKRIYRAVTSSTGTDFQFVAEIPLATADYLDTLTDAELGAVLESSLWALPPTDLRGILALPNGIMAGFAKNQLCLSAQNQPHAWPVEYRLNTDTDIVAIGNVDTTVVIGTGSFVYIASGNDPANYSMGKSDVPYACVSKRSLAYLPGIGVAFAGPDGLMVAAGVGNVRNHTETVFTRRQWQALVPETITAVTHNDIYFMWYDAGSAGRGGYAIDMKPTGFGIIELPFHASAAYADPVTGTLYVVLDENNEPDDPSLPVRAAPPAYANGTTLFAFEGSTALMTYRWRSKLWLMERPTTFGMCKVVAEDYDNLLLRFYGDGVEFYEVAVTSETVFPLPRVDAYLQFEIEVLGTSTVQTIQVAEDVLDII